MSHRVNKKRPAKRDRQSRTAVVRHTRKWNRGATKRRKATSRALPKFSAGGEQRVVSKNGATIHSKRPQALRHPKTDLEAAVQRYVDLYDFAPIAYVSFDRAGRIEEANFAATGLLDEPRDLLIGRPFAFYVADLDLFLQHLLNCRTSEQKVKTELQLKTRKGARIPAELLSTAITSTIRNGALLYQTAIMDLSDRKRAESALQESKRLLEAHVRERTHELDAANTELRNEIELRKGLEGEILAVSDREQQRLGQELHDGICQHLTGVAFMARSVALRLKNHRVIDAADIEKIAQLVNDAATDMRNLSRALHQSDVDAAKLVGALQDLVDREIWRTPCRLEVRPSFHIEDDMVAAQLYRIAREAVINANKHAQAREIVVRLERSAGGMVLRVTDDGVGLSNGAEPRRGLGFHIMNYRAQLMGGRLEIDSPKGRGTRVSCHLANKAVQSRKKENARPGLPGKITKALAALI